MLNSFKNDDAIILTALDQHNLEELKLVESLFPKFLLDTLVPSLLSSRLE